MTKRTLVKITDPIFLIVVVVAAFAAVRVRKAFVPSVEYFTAPVEKGPLQKIISATGTVQTVVTVPVGSQVSGQVQELFADFNSVVKRGQLLAKLDPRNLESAVANSRAQLAAAQARVRSAEAEIRTHKANLHSAQATLEGSRVGRDTSNLQLDRASVWLHGGHT